MLAIAVTLTGCGSSSSSSNSGGQITVNLTPASTSVVAGGTAQFTGTVTGTSNKAVMWSVDGAAGGNANVGTVNASGTYTAPSQAGSHTVTAASAADTTKSANATVTVTAPAVSVLISPTTTTVLAGATFQFTATVQGTTNTAVTWSVDTVSGGNSGSGTVNTSGLYTAPSQAGMHTVTATSVADTTKSANAAVTVTAPVTVLISPTSATLTAGTTQQFTATVQGTSNTAVTWSVDSVSGGNSGSGTVNASGLYTAPSQAGTHTVTATSVADITKSASATVTVNVNTGLTVTPAQATVAPSDTQRFTASSSATWSVDGVAGGNASTGTITSAGMYMAPFAIGAHIITATSTANSSVTGTSSLTVINSSPGAVLTYHNHDTRQGAFTEETVLTPANVKAATFGKLFAYAVDGQIYTQPLYLPQVNIGGINHEVVYVATEMDTVYAFDAKVYRAPLWSKSLGTPVSKNDIEGVSPFLGITSTPVIDITTGTIYVLAEATGYTVGPFKLHALDIATGAEKFGGPVYVWGSVQGTGMDSVNGTITLESSCYQRMGLALNPVNNTIEIAFGHCNHGWVLSYNKSTLQQTAIFNTTPNGGGGALWGGGGAPAIDDVTGETYLITGTDALSMNGDYNDAFLRLSANNLTVVDFFEPDNNFSVLVPNDADLGSGSNILMPDNSSSTPHETIGGGKDGNIFVVNRDDMGAFSTTSNNVIQTVQTGTKQFDNIFSTPAYWNGSLYYHPEDDVLHAYSWSGGKLSAGSKGAAVFAVHGATTSISANGNTNGIVWEIDNTNIGAGPSVLHAADASNVANELYNSSLSGSRDTAGTALKFTVPTIAGGKVFVPTANELDIFGLL